MNRSGYIVLNEFAAGGNRRIACELFGRAAFLMTADGAVGVTLGQVGIWNLMAEGEKSILPGLFWWQHIRSQILILVHH